MQLIPYLMFDGTCKQAFECYADVLRGTHTHMSTYGKTPVAAHVPPESRDRIMNARLVVTTATLMGGDIVLPGKSAAANPFPVALLVDDPAEAERIFHSLADGGSVEMPIGTTFSAERFSMCTDKFGTQWMITANLHD